MSKKTIDHSITESVLEHLRRIISPDSFEAYFAGLSIRIEDDGCATVLTSTRHAKDSLEKIYKNEIVDAVRGSYPGLIEVHFCATARSASESSATLGTVLNGSQAPTPSLTKPLLRPAFPVSHPNGKAGGHAYVAFEPPLSMLFRLENFENGVCNRIASAAAHTVVESPGEVYCPLIIYGSHGLGKTHLLQGIAQGLKERDPAAKVVYTSCEAFVNGYLSALQSRTLDAFRARFRSCDALVIDDVEFLSRTTKTQEELLHTIQYLRSARKQVVFSSAVAPSELVRMDPQLAEVLRSGLAIKLEAPEYDLRVKLLYSLARRRRWTLDDGAMRVLATHIEKSVGELEGALCKTVAVARACALQATSDLALSALRDLGHLRSGPTTLLDILNACAKTFSLKADDIRSDKRDANLAHARHVGMFVSRQVTAHTVAEIGRFYGNRDHSTVLHALRKIAAMAKREDAVQFQIRQIKQLLGIGVS